MAKNANRSARASSRRQGSRGKPAQAAAPAAKPESGKTVALIPLKKVCADLGIPANCATRAKLRKVWRNEENPGLQFHKHRARWDLTPEQVKEVKAILAPAE